jgi:hypothetical protein
MKDFKKMPKMACGGGVKKMSEGGNTSSKDLQYFADKRSPESKAAAEKRMTEYKEGKEKSMAQFRENMSNTSKAHDAKMAELMTKKPPTQSSSIKGGSGSAGGGDMSGMKGLDKPYKRGGKVKK